MFVFFFINSLILYYYPNGSRFCFRLTLDKNGFAPNGKCNGSPSDPPDSPDDLLANSLATLDDDVYADRLKVQCKLSLSNPTTPTADLTTSDRYPVRPPS